MGECNGRGWLAWCPIAGIALLEVLLATALLGGVLSLYVDAGRFALLHQRQAWDGTQALLAGHSLLEAAVANSAVDYAGAGVVSSLDCARNDCVPQALADWELARWREGLQAGLSGGQGVVEHSAGRLRVGVGWRHSADGGEQWLWLEGP